MRAVRMVDSCRYCVVFLLIESSMVQYTVVSIFLEID